MEVASNFPLVSIVSVNYNEPEVTRDFLTSVFNNSYTNFEVIIVDNGSTKKVDKIIEKEFPEVKYIFSEENLGFSGGNNLAIDIAQGRYVFLVNNDTVFTDSLIETLLSRFETSSEIGVVCPKIKYFFNPTVIQYAGYTEMNPFTARNRALGNKEEDKGQCDVAMKTPYGHGAAFMISKKVINDVGLMPEEFFLYYEELDWCEKIKKAGYEIWYEPKGIILHKESVSVGKMSAFKTYYLTRNRILFVRRNMKVFQQAMFTLFLFFFTIPKNTILFFLKGQWSHLRSFWIGIVWNLTHKKNNGHG